MAFMQARFPRLALTLIAGLSLALLLTALVSLAAYADGGAWPTLTPSPTFTLIPTMTFTPLPSPTFTATPLVYPAPPQGPQAVIPTITPTPEAGGDGLLGFACWPIALLIIFAVIIGGAALLRNRI